MNTWKNSEQFFLLINNMKHTIFIIIGIILLSISISNPVYKISIKKYLKLNLIFEILLRIFIFICSVFLIFFGLYIESVF